MKTAVLDPSGTFRYTLGRRWAPGGTTMLFIMLNPSTADADVDDPTIRRCVGFAQAGGHSALQVVNLFAFRATKPADLKAAGWPIGPDNDTHIMSALADAQVCVCAWGANVRGHRRVAEVLDMVRLWHTPFALAFTDDGIPRHPLYLPGDSVLQPVL